MKIMKKKILNVLKQWRNIWHMEVKVQLELVSKTLQNEVTARFLFFFFPQILNAAG